MRGSDGMQEAMFTFSKLEDFVPADHPLRAIAGVAKFVGFSYESRRTLGSGANCLPGGHQRLKLRM